MSPMSAPKKAAVPDPKQITLRDLDGDQRRDAAMWCKIMQEWLNIRAEKADELGGKGKVDEMYCASMKLQYFLQIEMHNAIVRNAKAKPIERKFGTFKNHFSRAIETFCGGTVIERPESLKWTLKQGKLPTDLQIKAALGVFIDGDYNVDP